MQGQSAFLPGETCHHAGRQPCSEEQIEMAGVSRGHITVAVTPREGPNVKEDKFLSSLRDELRRQTVPDRDPLEKGKAVSPPELSQRAEPSPARDEDLPHAAGERVWEQVLARANLFQALERVVKNGGSPGIDGMTVEDLRPYLIKDWLEIRASLDAGRYQPSPVRRVEIAKPDGGVRLIGIPTVVDRLIQQALAQVLTPLCPCPTLPRSVGGPVRRSEVLTAELWVPARTVCPRRRGDRPRVHPRRLHLGG